MGAERKWEVIDLVRRLPRGGNGRAVHRRVS